MDANSNGAKVQTEAIRFGFGECWLGNVLVAASGKSVAAILLGSDRAALGRELAAAFPDARIIGDATGLGKMLAQVVAFLDAPDEGLDLPLDLRGSALEQAVWKTLRDVPAGRTVTYGEIAKKIAKTLPLPATAQDIGAACAANVLAVAIPCHRVVKADGSISGYRWGVQRKRKLINREALAGTLA
jgi:AraC family transcriptional regulator, regulatory protein of adaptative response / methylated-DNA-[protein]-cysteine methyltransferase